MSGGGASAGEVAAHFFRHEGAKVVAALTAHLGTRRLQLAEDMVQEALLRAAHLAVSRRAGQSGRLADPGGEEPGADRAAT